MATEDSVSSQEKAKFYQKVEEGTEFLEILEIDGISVNSVEQMRDEGLIEIKGEGTEKTIRYLEEPEDILDTGKEEKSEISNVEEELPEIDKVGFEGKYDETIPKMEALFPLNLDSIVADEKTTESERDGAEITSFSSWDGGSNTSNTERLGDDSFDKTLVHSHSNRAKRELKELYSEIQKGKHYLDFGEKRLGKLDTVDDVEVTEFNRRSMIQLFNQQTEKVEFGNWEYREDRERDYVVIENGEESLEIEIDRGVPEGYDEESLAIYTHNPDQGYEFIGAFTSREGLGELISEMR